MAIDLTAAHKHSSQHRAELAASDEAGCFYCQTIFDPATITEWIDENDDTATCPECGIDSVIGDASGLPINTEFLADMHSRWFEKSFGEDDPEFYEALGIRVPVSVRIGSLFRRKSDG